MILTNLFLFYSSMQSSEGGRKLNQAVNTTSKAIIQAKGAFSNWWSSVTTPTTQIVQGQPDIGGFADEEDLEIVGSVGDDKKTLNNEEIGAPAEEFLASEVEVAKKEVPSPEEIPKTGDVFTV